MCVFSVAQLSSTLCDPMDCNPPAFSVLGILQAKILEWVAIPSSRGSSQPRDQTHISPIPCIARFVTIESPGKPRFSVHVGRKTRRLLLIHLGQGALGPESRP